MALRVWMLHLQRRGHELRYRHNAAKHSACLGLLHGSDRWESGHFRVACISTGSDHREKHFEEPEPFHRSRARIQRTRDSIIKTRDSLRETRGRVTANVKQTKRMVSEQMGHFQENVMTIPNGLSMARLCSSPVLGYLVLTGSYTPALALFAAAGVTDVLDGWIARAFPSQQSNLGTVVDPLADKCLVATLFLSLTIAGLIPVPLTALILSRDVIIVGCAVYLRYISLPAPKTFVRFFDVTLTTIKFSPTAISKANTAIQLGLVAVTLAAPVFNFVDHAALHALWYMTAATTTVSGLMYIFSKDSYKFIRGRL